MSRKPTAQRGLSRRDLLAMSGLGLGASFLPSLARQPSSARAAPSSVPRIVIMTTDHQVMPDVWRHLRGNSEGEAFEYPWSDVPVDELPPALAPLGAYKDRLLAVDGLSLASGIPNTGFFQGHALSASNLLAAAGYAADDDQFLPRGPTVDQVIAASIAHPDRIPSLELGTKGNGNSTYVATGFKEKPPIEHSLERLATRLYPPALAAEPTREERIAIANSRVLDLTKRQYDRIAPQLSGADREKLELHRSMIDDLERRQVEMRSLGCQNPVLDYGTTNKKEKVALFGKMVGAAFACDAVRVATIQVNQLANDEFGAPPGDVHQDVAHQADKSETAAEHMRNYTITNAEIFAKLVDEIAQYSDEAGSLLDSTLVVWMGEHGLTSKAHTAVEHGALIVGNIGGHFRTGRYVSLPRDTRHPKEGKDPMGVPHSHLLVSLMQACGLSENTIGLTEYEVHDGTRVSLSGPIDRLLA